MTALADFAPLFSACGLWQIGAAGALAKVSPEICQTSRELSDASSEAHSKGTLALQYTRDVAEVLKVFQGGAGLDMNAVTQIKEMIEEKKARKALGLAREMDDMAKDMTRKANHIAETLTKSVEEMVPENVRGDMEETTTTNNNTRGIGEKQNNTVHDEEAAALMELLSHADSDVEEVQVNTRSMEQADTSMIGSTGRDAYVKVAEKEDVVVKILNEIKSVSNTIVDTLVMGASGSSLCAQFMAATAGVEALMKSLRLSKLIQRALQTVRRILEAFMSFINTSWGRFQNFFDQFDGVGQKLEDFADGIKNAFGGKMGKLGKVFG